MKKINPTNCQSAPQRQPYAETRGSDPDGNYFDISEHGFFDVQRWARKNRAKQPDENCAVKTPSPLSGSEF